MRDFAIRGLTADNTQISATNDHVSLEISSPEKVTVEFRFTPAGASALARDLAQVADTIRNAVAARGRLDELGAEIIYAPKAEIVDFGELEGRNEVYVVIQTEDGPQQRFRFSPGKLLESARLIVRNLQKPLRSRHPRSH